MGLFRLQKNHLVSIWIRKEIGFCLAVRMGLWSFEILKMLLPICTGCSLKQRPAARSLNTASWAAWSRSVAPFWLCIFAQMVLSFPFRHVKKWNSQWNSQLCILYFVQEKSTKLIKMTCPKGENLGQLTCTSMQIWVTPLRLLNVSGRPMSSLHCVFIVHWKTTLAFHECHECPWHVFCLSNERCTQCWGFCLFSYKSSVSTVPDNVLTEQQDFLSGLCQSLSKSDTLLSHWRNVRTPL